MLESIMGRRLFSLAESGHLRIEAMQLFEQCLTSGDTTIMVAFIERQLLNEPPRLQLLREIADDLQQRLLSLREYHFDVRERVVSTLNESYSVDISSLTPPALPDRYHHLTADDVLTFIRQCDPQIGSSDLVILRKMIEASLQIAAQLSEDIRLTRELHNLILDWTEALSAATARHNWSDSTAGRPKPDNGIISH
jgi:hypothetical protein